MLANDLIGQSFPARIIHRIFHRIFCGSVSRALSRIVAPSIEYINNDGVVDIKDIDYVARRFGITPSDPLWNPIADINKDNKLDMKDIALVARHFGETDT